MNARSKICREICPHLTRKQRIECRIKEVCMAYKEAEKKEKEKEEQCKT